jgi:hypothetical protein
MDLVMIETLALLIFGHALGDYPLQGSFLARAKDRTAPVEGVPWYQAMAAHSVIHGGLVGLITGSVVLGVCETVCHAAIDDAKCTGRVGLEQDQGLHIMCKVAWVAAIWAFGDVP